MTLFQGNLAIDFSGQLCFGTLHKKNEVFREEFLQQI